MDAVELRRLVVRHRHVAPMLSVVLASTDARVTINQPANATASPHGWHDTNNAHGAEYTVTRGNNVWAGLDVVSPNGIDSGSEAQGGTGLDFIHTINLGGAPSTYRPAAVTNLFVWNNYMHDVSYLYGFNEVEGNFQSNNYGRGGLGNDYVRAEAQDGDIVFSGSIVDGGEYGFYLHDGDVLLEVPADVSARVNVSTFDGEFSSDFPVQVESFSAGRQFDFVLGQGGALIDIEVFDGEIRLARRP